MQIVKRGGGILTVVFIRISVRPSVTVNIVSQLLLLSGQFGRTYLLMFVADIRNVRFIPVVQICLSFFNLY